jgi:hypothetical protein
MRVVASKKQLLSLHSHLPRRGAPPARTTTITGFVDDRTAMTIQLPALKGQRARSIVGTNTKYASSTEAMVMGGRPMVALPSSFEMKNRSLPGDRQRGNLVPLSLGGRRTALLRAHSFVGPGTVLCSEPEQIDAHRGCGRSRPDAMLAARVWFDLERPATGQRMSFGLSKHLDDTTALCSGCVCIKRATADGN